MHSQWYESQMSISAFGSTLQPLSLSDLLATFNNVMSVVRCAGYCNQQQLCRFFDHDMTTGICRIFDDGVTVLLGPSKSRVGTFYDAPSLYSSHGQSCAPRNCQFNRNLICATSNTCECAAALVWNAPKCVGRSSFFTDDF